MDHGWRTIRTLTRCNFHRWFDDRLQRFCIRPRRLRIVAAFPDAAADRDPDHQFRRVVPGPALLADHRLRLCRLGQGPSRKLRNIRVPGPEHGDSKTGASSAPKLRAWVEA